MIGADNLLVGVIALALLPLIGLRILRAVRSGEVPLYRTHLRREDDRTKFTALLALHCASFMLMGVIGLDLVLGTGWLVRS